MNGPGFSRAPRNAKDMEGVCSSCQEWTTVHECCCSAPVMVEGSLESYEDYCEGCGDELNGKGECERCERIAGAYPGF